MKVVDLIVSHLREAKHSVRTSAERASSWLFAIHPRMVPNINDYNSTDVYDAASKKKEQAQDVRDIMKRIRDIITTNDLLQALEQAQNWWRQYPDDVRESTRHEPLFPKSQIIWMLRIMAADLDDEDRGKVEAFAQEWDDE